MTDTNSNDVWILECADLQRLHWESGTPITVEELCQQFDQLADREDIKLELVMSEYSYREVAGEDLDVDEFASRFPELADSILETLAAMERGDSLERESDQVDGQFRYELFEKVGSGGMGTVHRARDRRTDKIVALKWIHSGSIPGAALAEEALREARTASRVTHALIVQVFDTGVYDGRAFIVMRFVEGTSLASQILDAGQIDQRRAARIMANVCEAVAAAHEAKVTHRDLKPDNILIDHGDKPHVTDFGIARLVDDPNVDERLSLAILGTPQYSSPERLSGGSDRNHPTTDVWSLGVVLYEMLSGKCPFYGTTPAEIARRVEEDEPAPLHRVAAVSRDLSAICHRCLEKRPGDRYVDVGSLGEDLRLFLDDKPIFARPVSLFGQIVRWRRREPKIARLALLVVSVVALASVLLTWFAWKERDAATIAKQNRAADGY